MYDLQKSYRLTRLLQRTEKRRFPAAEQQQLRWAPQFGI